MKNPEKNRSHPRTPKFVPSFPELIACGYAASSLLQQGCVPTLLYVTSEKRFFSSTGGRLDLAGVVKKARLLCIAVEQANAVMVLIHVGEDPNEALILSAEAGDRKIQKLWPIIKTADGDFVGFGEPQTLPCPCYGLLPQTDPSPEERTRARRELQRMGVRGWWNSSKDSRGKKPKTAGNRIQHHQGDEGGTATLKQGS